MAKELTPKIVRNADGSGSKTPGQNMHVEGGRVIALSIDAKGMADLEKRAQATGKTVEEITTEDLKDIVNW